eukprot:198842-Pyramimonas_sp.AAC.1
MAEGRRPSTDVWGRKWDGDHIMSRMHTTYGGNLGFRAALVWLKGDLSDMNKTHGLPAVWSKNNP